MVHLKLVLGYHRKLKRNSLIGNMIELSPFVCKYDIFNLLQLHAGNSYMVYNVKEIDLKICRLSSNFSRHHLVCEQYTNSVLTCQPFSYTLSLFSINNTIQLYVIKFVIDLRQVGGFLRILLFLPPIKLTTTI